MKRRKKLIIGIALVLVLCLIALLGAGQYMLDYSLSPVNRGKDLTGSWQYMTETYPQLKPWADSLQQANALRDTFIAAPDSVKLHAYYVNAAQPTGRTAVIIHGEADEFVPTEMVYRLYEAKPEPKELWISPGEGHARSYYHNTEEYTTRVNEFIKRYIP